MAISFVRARALNHLYNNSKSIESGCREWQGPLNAAGYGQLAERWILSAFGIKGAHRLMVHLVHGFEFTDRRQHVMHSCHNRRCVNPEHLSVGTPAQNMRDACLEGSFDKKLTPAKVEMIRAARHAGINGYAIAAHYQVQPTMIYKVANYRAWMHFETPEARLIELQPAVFEVFSRDQIVNYRRD